MSSGAGTADDVAGAPVDVFDEAVEGVEGEGVGEEDGAAEVGAAEVGLSADVPVHAVSTSADGNRIVTTRSRRFRMPTNVAFNPSAVRFNLKNICVDPGSLFLLGCTRPVIVAEENVLSDS